MMLLRLLHLSDLHFTEAGGPSASLYRAALGPSDMVSKLIQRLFAQGVSGHDSRALKRIQWSMRDYCSKDSEENTYVVCTGDLTTWGDLGSLTRAKAFVEHDICRNLKLPGPLFVYGNHDVWPGKFGSVPFAAEQDTLGQNRSHMRDRHFPKPLFTELVRSRQRDLTLGIGALNTVLHCKFENTLARGTVQHDFYWEGRKTARHQLEQLREWLRGVDVAIVLTHHPVYDPTPWPMGSRGPVAARGLTNAGDLRRVLETRSESCANAIRLVLSGHTHAVHPKMLEPKAVMGSAVKVCQLTIGTCAQAPASKGKFEHTWQAIELDHNKTQNFISVRRQLFSRQNGFRSFVAQRREDLHLAL